MRDLLKKRIDLHVNPQFLAELTNARLLEGFTGLKLASREFP